MFSKTIAKLCSVAVISGSRGWELNQAAVCWRGDRSSRVSLCRGNRLEIQTVHCMDPQTPVGKLLKEEKELCSTLVAMSLGEVGKSSQAGQSDVGKLKATTFEMRNADGGIVNDLGKVEAGKVGKSEQHDMGKSQTEMGKVEAGKVGKIEQHDIGKSQNEIGKVEGGCVGKSEGRHDVGKSQNEVGKVQSVNPGKCGIHDQGKIEDSTRDKLGLKVAADVGKHHPTIKGKIEEILQLSGHRAKVPQEVGGAQKHVAGKHEKYSEGTLGNTGLKCIIVLAAKFTFDVELFPALAGVTELKLPEGAEMLSISEVTDPSLKESFDASEYLTNLKSSQFGAFILYSPVIPSTQSLLSQNFHAFPQGTICLAGAQLQGKGRAGNVWESPKGCLMFSFTIKMTSGRLLPFLQYVVSLAVIEGVEETCKTRILPVPELRIKWPNDLYANGLKIGGVLCTSTYSAKTFNIVVGVGLNVGNREPTTCLDALIQELDPQAGALRHEELVATIMSRFEKLNDTFSADGFSPLQDSYYDKWLHGGQTVVLEEKDTKSSEVAHIPVTIRGLTSTGYLLATDEQDEKYELHPDGNSFDFLKGLVRSKFSS